MDPLIVLKTKQGPICKGLTFQEYKCRCKDIFCRATICTQRLVQSYSSLRTTLDIPLTILSGFRCARHNYYVGGVSRSRHLIGEAIDINADNILKQFTKDEVIELAGHAGFSYVQYYSGQRFFHLDVRGEK